MNPQPRQLALLISLIGVSVAPSVWARSELRVARDAPSLQDLLPEAHGDAPVVASDPRWLPLGNALDDATVSSGWLLSAAPAAESSEEATSDEVADAPPPERDDEPVADRRVLWLAPLADAAPTHVEPFTVGDDGVALERTERAEALAEPTQAQAQPAPAKRADEQRADPRPAPGLRLVVVSARAEAQRVLDTLAAVVDESVALPTSVQVVDDAPSTQETLPTRLAESTAAPRRDPAEIVVDTESSKVLRLLEAIRSDERDAVGAVSVDNGPVIVTSQSEKVLAMLAEVVPSPRATASDAAPVDIALPLEPPPVPQVPRPSPFGGEQLALDESRLDGVRGGFVGEGLNISFGIERAVYVNGVLVTTTSLNMSELGRMTAGRGTTSFDAGTIGLVQSGAGNVVTPGVVSSSALHTVVQNTLDGQKIQSVTVINATANSVGVLRSLNFQSSMRSAVIDSLRR